MTDTQTVPLRRARAYWACRAVLERSLAFVYLIAFLCAANQFVPLVGARGLLPIADFVRFVAFRDAPSLFFFWSSDLALQAAAWIGVVLSAAVVSGIAARSTLASAAIWLSMWALYLSFVNVGQVFYGFGWESMLLEAGFYAVFLGGRASVASPVVIWLFRWILFRDMFGAGLIKLRGDDCWRALTCLDYYFETQPMPNALSWYFHWLPAGVHRAGVVFNHVAELAVPFMYLAAQPVAAIGGLVTIVFQLTLIVSGNLSWLNWLTVVLCVPLLDDSWWRWLPIRPPGLAPQSRVQQAAAYALAALVALLSIGPVANMWSADQMMNASFNPVHLVNTYGAFGSITRERFEIVVEGTADGEITPATRWREYEFKGKPGDPATRPPQVAPYHFRLDWLMWFAAMSPPEEHPWSPTLLDRLLEGDAATLGLLKLNPFSAQPPHFVRAQYYRYRFTTPAERQATGQWWHRELIGSFMPPRSVASRAF